MSLPICNASMTTISATYAIKKLLGCRAERAEDRETKRHEVEAVTSTRLCVLVPLRLLYTGQSRGCIAPAPARRGDPDKIDTTVAIIAPSVQEDVRRPSKPGTVARLRALIA